MGVDLIELVTPVSGAMAAVSFRLPPGEIRSGETPTLDPSARYETNDPAIHEPPKYWNPWSSYLGHSQLHLLVERKADDGAWNVPRQRRPVAPIEASDTLLSQRLSDDLPCGYLCAPGSFHPRSLLDNDPSHVSLVPHGISPRSKKHFQGRGLSNHFFLRKKCWGFLMTPRPWLALLLPDPNAADEHCTRDWTPGEAVPWPYTVEGAIKKMAPRFVTHQIQVKRCRAFFVVVFLNLQFASTFAHAEKFGREARDTLHEMWSTAALSQDHAAYLECLLHEFLGHEHKTARRIAAGRRNSVSSGPRHRPGPSVPAGVRAESFALPSTGPLPMERKRPAGEAEDPNLHRLVGAEVQRA